MNERTSKQANTLNGGHAKRIRVKGGHDPNNDRRRGGRGGACSALSGATAAGESRARNSGHGDCKSVLGGGDSVAGQQVES